MAELNFSDEQELTGQVLDGVGRVEKTFLGEGYSKAKVWTLQFSRLVWLEHKGAAENETRGKWAPEMGGI